MASELRLQKLNELLKEEIAKIIEREVEFPEGILVTVTRVNISSDCYYASVLISILGEEVKGAMEILSKNVYHIQQILNRKVRMRPVPQIHFAMDEEELRRENVEKSLAELKRKGDL